MPQSTTRRRTLTLQALCQSLEITDGWDLLLVGDGSGSNWRRGAGWATVAIEKRAVARRVFYGAMSSGTNNVAETMAYVHPLLFYAAQNMRDPWRVHVITDSEYVATNGNRIGRGSLAVGTHDIVWSMLWALSRRGWSLQWHHAHRGQIALNVYVDMLSRGARIMLETHDLPHTLKGVQQMEPGSINP